MAAGDGAVDAWMVLSEVCECGGLGALGVLGDAVSLSERVGDDRFEGAW